LERVSASIACGARIGFAREKRIGSSARIDAQRTLRVEPQAGVHTARAEALLLVATALRSGKGRADARRRERQNFPCVLCAFA
jgi:hypothetical protein